MSESDRLYGSEHRFVLGSGGTLSEFGIVSRELGDGFFEVWYTGMGSMSDVRISHGIELRVLDEVADRDIINDYVRLLNSLDNSFLVFKVLLNGIEEFREFHVLETEWMESYRDFAKL